MDIGNSITVSDSELWTRFFGTNNEEERQEAIIEIGRRLRESGLTEDPSNVVVSIGERWRGHALSEVFECDPEYVRWLESTGPAYLRTACAWLRQTQRLPAPAPRHDIDPWNSQ